MAVTIEYGQPEARMSARSLVVRAFLVTVVSVVWMVPLARATRFLICAWGAYDGTVDAANDYVFGVSLLASYSLSYGVALALAWLWARARTSWMLIPIAAAVLVAIDVIRLSPERVIVFIPDMHPFRPAGFSLVVALAGALIIWMHRRHEGEQHECEQGDR